MCVFAYLSHIIIKFCLLKMPPQNNLRGCVDLTNRMTLHTRAFKCQIKTAYA